MTKLRAKLKSRAGETLAEVLIALLVSTVAVVMLASMITSSVKIILKSSETMKAYYEDTSLISPAGDTGSVTVKFGDGSDSTDSYTLSAKFSETYKLGGKDIISYLPDAGGGSTP